jgi:hypothetical protein
MTDRERLPNRRSAEVVEFVHDNRRWTLTIGRFPDGRIAEIFLDLGKVEPLGELAQDTAIVASLALQHGCSIETLKSAIAGRSVRALGAALAMIEVETGRQA